MSGLRDRIVRLIETNGPIGVADYMTLCLFDPAEGYYTTRQPFGVEGDFTTAPEISQMFGELIGVWVYSAWTLLGRPLPVAIAEIGPGRGTLMKDMLRTLVQLDAGLANRASFAMIEISPNLAVAQKDTLDDCQANISWHAAIDTLPKNPLIVVANELFDAIPVRQFVLSGQHWLERCVGLDQQNELRFVTGAALLDTSFLPAEVTDAPPGSIFEVSPGRIAMMDNIASRIAIDGGAGLFVDYGHVQPGLGDTLQAVRKHRHEGVFDNPGEADLTSHVDFAALARVARHNGLDAHLTTQGDFLLRSGLLERAGRLGADANPTAREKIASEVERLAGPDAMGNLFKVLAVLHPNTFVPPFGASR